MRCMKKKKKKKNVSTIKNARDGNFARVPIRIIIYIYIFVYKV